MLLTFRLLRLDFKWKNTWVTTGKITWHAGYNKSHYWIANSSDTANEWFRSYLRKHVNMLLLCKIGCSDQLSSAAFIWWVGKSYCLLKQCVAVCAGRVRLEAFSDNSGKLQLSLQEIIEWLTAKDEELSEQLPIGGDVGAVQHQREFHQVTWIIPFQYPFYKMWLFSKGKLDTQLIHTEKLVKENHTCI